MKQHKCLWYDLVDSKIDFPAFEGESTVDICIIGGGYTGLNAAIVLAEHQYKVCILESRTIGSGGSGQSVGLVNAGTWHPPNELNQQLGPNLGPKLNKILSQTPQIVFELIDQYNINAQDKRNGNLHMAHNLKGEADIRNRYQQLMDLGAPVELIQGKKCHEYCGTTAIQLALLDKRAGTINPYAYVIGLANTAFKKGVMISENTHVESLLPLSNGRWQVSGANFHIAAEKVIIATNAYTEGEWTDIRKTFYPVYYFQIASEPLNEAQSNSILPYGQGAWDTRLALSTIRKDKDNRLLLGTVGNGYNKESILYSCWAETMKSLYFPNLKCQWQYEWTGRFAFTHDHIFRIFEPAENIVTTVGFNGRGITTGTLMGRHLAEYIIRGSDENLPLPIQKVSSNHIKFRNLKSTGYEIGLKLYHAGQCLKIIS